MTAPADVVTGPRWSRRARSIALRLALVAPVPLAVGFVAAELRRAEGPFWLATNQDPAYTYLFDSLRVAVGLPPNQVLHPGTTVHLLGAAVLRAQHPDPTRLASAVLADPEPSLGALHAVLLGTCLAALLALGWSTLAVTGSPVLAWLAQAAPFLLPGPLLELAGAKPEPLLLAFGVLVAALVLRATVPGDDRDPRPVLLGIALGLATATKFTAIPLLLVPLAVLQTRAAVFRFAAAAVASFVLGALPAVLRLPEVAQFLWRSAREPGAYGTGFLRELYGPRLGAMALGSAPLLVAVMLGLAAAVVLRRRSARRASRLAFGVVGAQAAAGILVAIQPYGGARYLVPVVGLLGLNLLLVARAFVFDDTGRARPLPAALGFAAIAALFGQQIRLLPGQSAEFLRLAGEQQAAARAARSLGGCALVEYHKASSVPSALLFGYGRAPVDGGMLGLLQRLYPSALFLDYVESPEAARHASFRFLPHESWTHPRFRAFNGGVSLSEVVAGRSCVIFQGTSAGPGRLYGSPEFSPRSIPIAGSVEPIYRSSIEALYRVDVEERPDGPGPRRED